MKFSILALTFALVSTSHAIHDARSAHVAHRNVARSFEDSLPLMERAIEEMPRKRLAKRCKIPTNSTSTASVVESSTSTTHTTSVATVPTSSTHTTSVVVVPTTSSTKTTSTAAPPASKPPATSSKPPASTPSEGIVNIKGPSNGHKFTIINKCSHSVTPVVADTKCGYSPRCGDASSYSGGKPQTLSPGQTEIVTIDDNWVGRIFDQNGNCGAKGEDCTILEFNLDSGSFFTPQAYDISNIQGFTQSISVGAQGCATATCTSATCSCSNAYPIGDETGCGDDAPVKACGAGNIPFEVVFCP